MIAPPRTVLVVSSNPLFGEAAVAYLDRREGWRAVGPVNDGLLALSTIGRNRPSAVLVINDLYRIGPAAFARQILRRWSDITVVVLGEIDESGVHAVSSDAEAKSVLVALATPPGRPGDADSEEVVSQLTSLTRRERRILSLLSEGLSRSQIAARLNVSEHTVRTHLQNLYSKLAIHNRVDALRFAADHGLVDPTRAHRPD